MVYLENSAIRFWRCEQISPTNVVIQYGKCGSEGRKLLKEFEESCEAESYIFKQEASKRKSGYVDAKDPVTGSHNRKRKSKAVTPCSSKKVGLAKYPPSNMDHAIEVDSGLKVVNKILFRKAEVYLKLHAKLAQVEPTQNMDKYYIIQTIVDSNHKRPKTARRKILYPNFYLFTRWGHTGTGGQAKLEGPFNEPNDAIKKFESIFKSKTGVDWSSSIPGTSPLQGKYEHLGTKMNPQEKGSWLYYLENDPLGKVSFFIFSVLSSSP